MVLAYQGAERLMHPGTTSGITFHARWLSMPSHRVEADCLSNLPRSLPEGEGLIRVRLY
jgi:hypothetical protein